MKVFAPLATVAEAMAVRMAGQMAENLELVDAMVESDCLLVIEACRESAVRLDLQHIINEIWAIRSRFHLRGFT